MYDHLLIFIGGATVLLIVAFLLSHWIRVRELERMNEDFYDPFNCVSKEAIDKVRKVEQMISDKAADGPY